MSAVDDGQWIWMKTGPCERDLLAVRDVRRRERSGYGAARARMARGSQHSSSYQYELVLVHVDAMCVFLLPAKLELKGPTDIHMRHKCYSHP